MLTLSYKEVEKTSKYWDFSSTPDEMTYTVKITDDKNYLLDGKIEVFGTEISDTWILKPVKKIDRDYQ